MTHGSLFSGIGGFDLAAEWMGWENLFHCEIEPFCQKVLKHYWPNAETFIDIKNSNFKKYEKKVDVLTGGFPCQPYSMAGKRRGKDDDRHLWPYMLTAIRTIKPRWIVGENVFGLINWSNGLVFEEVQLDLEAAGYEVQPFILPAAAIGAPHRRDRIFFIAHSNNNGSNKCNISNEIKSNKGRFNALNNINESNGNGNASNANCNGLQKRIQSGSNVEQKRNRQIESFAECLYPHKRKVEAKGWENFPTVPPICSGNDGFSDKLDGITFSKWRQQSIKGYGNAVVPPLIYTIFKSIQEYENLNLGTEETEQK